MTLYELYGAQILPYRGHHFSSPYLPHSAILFTMVCRQNTKLIQPIVPSKYSLDIFSPRMPSRTRQSNNPMITTIERYPTLIKSRMIGMGTAVPVATGIVRVHQTGERARSLSSCRDQMGLVSSLYNLIPITGSVPAFFLTQNLKKKG